MSKAVAVTMMKVLLTCYSFLWEEEMKLDWLVRSSLNLILCQVHMICAKWGYFQVWNGVAWLGRVHCPGHPLLLLVVQTCRKLALFAQKGESTDAICNLSLCLAASELAPTLHASGPFLTWFLHQPPLKGTFSMQENIKAVFTCRFPSESFISLQPRGPQHQPKLNMGLKLYPGRPGPDCPCSRHRGTCLCKCARACARRKTDVCCPE